MEIEFHQTIDDYYLAQRYIGRRAMRNSLWRFVPLAMWIIFGLALGYGFMAIFDLYRSVNLKESCCVIIDLGLPVAGIIAAVVGLNIHSLAVDKRLYAKGGLFRALHTLALTTKGIDIRVRENLYHYDWQNVFAVETDDIQVYIFVDQGVAIFVPANAFEDSEARTTFMQEVGTYISKKQA